MSPVVRTQETLLANRLLRDYSSSHAQSGCSLQLSYESKNQEPFDHIDLFVQAVYH